jgi:hypothetical protein
MSFTEDRNDLDKKLHNGGYDKLSKIVRCTRSCKTQFLRMFTCALALWSYIGKRLITPALNVS